MANATAMAPETQCRRARPPTVPTTPAPPPHIHRLRPPLASLLRVHKCCATHAAPRRAARAHSTFSAVVWSNRPTGMLFRLFWAKFLQPSMIA